MLVRRCCFFTDFPSTAALLATLLYRELQHSPIHVNEAVLQGARRAAVQGMRLDRRSKNIMLWYNELMGIPF